MAIFSTSLMQEADHAVVVLEPMQRMPFDGSSKRMESVSLGGSEMETSRGASRAHLVESPHEKFKNLMAEQRKEAKGIKEHHDKQARESEKAQQQRTARLQAKKTKTKQDELVRRRK